MFVHFERWTLPVLTTWMYAWQDKTVIDAHDKLLKLFSNTSTFRNQYIYIYTGLCRNLPLEPRKNLCPLLYNAVMKHGSWPYILDKSFLQWIILFFCHFLNFFIGFFVFVFFFFLLWFELQECLHIQETVLYQVDKYYRTSALPLQFLT